MNVNTPSWRVSPARALLPAATALAGVAGLLAPSLALPCAVAAALAVGTRLTRSPAMGRPPLRVPDDGPDAGTWFVGTDRDGGGQVWLSDADVRDHLAVVGTTGSGKTEFMIGLAANAAYRGGGFLMIDGKGDVAVYAKLQALAASCGRQGDLLLLSFMDESGAGVRLHGFNPLASGDAAALVRIVASIMGTDWPGDVRAEGMFLLDGVTRVLVHMRDRDGAKIGLRTLVDLLDHDALVALDADGGDARLPRDVTRHLGAYLSSLPPGPDGVVRHQAVTAPISAKLGALLREHPHVLREGKGDVDMTDVVRGGRMLFVLLPIMGRSRDDVAALGRMVTAALEVALRSASAWSRPTRDGAPPPFLCVMDEVGYYVPDDLGTLSGLARGAGVGLVLTAQDPRGLAPLQGCVRQGTRPFGTTIVMRVEDEVTARAALSLVPADHAVAYRDVKGQREGEVHMFKDDVAVRVKVLYADPASLVDRRSLRLEPDVLVDVPRRRTNALVREVA